MPWTRAIKIAVRDSVYEIATIVAVAVLLILVFNLRFGVVYIFYPVVLASAVVGVFLFVKTLTVARFYKRLEAAEVSALDEPAEGEVQARVFEVIGKIRDTHFSEIHRLRGLIDARNALFSQFVHGMKSSVAVIELAGEKLEFTTNTAVIDILSENAKLKNNLEQALNILRLDAFANDYAPEKVQLAELVQATINEHKRDFIYSSIYPKLTGEGTAYTDPKWCGLIISQIITNAIKYSKTDTSVVFAIVEQGGVTCLNITDYGIGIPSEDLPRVFDIFFTGQNGRARKDSSGIGLFMAKFIAQKLGIGIKIDSVQGEGTTVVLEFKLL
jgi:signal transduction histidine kinase